MKCIRCFKEAEYVYIYSIPLTGIIFTTEGGSVCRDCLVELSTESKKGIERWKQYTRSKAAERDKELRTAERGKQ